MCVCVCVCVSDLGKALLQHLMFPSQALQFRLLHLQPCLGVLRGGEGEEGR